MRSELKFDNGEISMYISSATIDEILNRVRQDEHYTNYITGILSFCDKRADKLEQDERDKLLVGLGFIIDHIIEDVLEERI